MTSFTWTQVEALLKAGCGIRFCRSKADAESAITNGIPDGDYVAVFESFPYLVKLMMNKKAITLKDSNMAKDTSVHGDLRFWLSKYIETLRKPGKPKDVADAWELVENLCFSEDGFTNDVKGKIAAEVYSSLEKTFEWPSGWDQAAVVLVKAHDSTRYNKDKNFGSFAKAGAHNIAPTDFSRQMWVVALKDATSDAIQVKFQRFVNAVIHMATDCLTKGL